jgi:hypothetical protein
MHVHQNQYLYILIHFTSPTWKIPEQGMKVFFESKPPENNLEA